jgi:hypothetical protein
MLTVVGILFTTRKTFQKLDNEFTDDLNVKTSIIFCIAGLASGIRTILEATGHFIEPKMWATALLLLMSVLFSLVIGRYVVSKILYKISRLLKGQAEEMDLIVVAAYATIPLLIEVPVTIYKVFGLRGTSTTWDYVILNGFHVVSWALSIKIMIQGLKEYNEYSTLKAVITTGPFILLPIFLYSLTRLLSYG